MEKKGHPNELLDVSNLFYCQLIDIHRNLKKLFFISYCPCILLVWGEILLSHGRR